MHQIMGPRHHPMSAIQSLNANRVNFSHLFFNFCCYPVHIGLDLNLYKCEFSLSLPLTSNQNLKTNHLPLPYLEQKIEKPSTFSTFRERLHHLQVTFDCRCLWSLAGA